MRHLTLVEGWTLEQVITAAETNPYLLHDIEKLSKNEFSTRLGSTQANFEGMLFPDTYLFAAGISDVTLLKKAYTQMQRTLNLLWEKRAPNLPYTTPYSALIVASLIEKETAKPDERARVGGVILRRLEKKMPLQIDAAVIYGLGKAYTGKIMQSQLKVNTPYNTYLHKGLPPTPIALPSLASIIAALHPTSETALYYVARGDGSHEFSDTFETHHQAVKRYRQLPAHAPASNDVSSNKKRP